MNVIAPQVQQAYGVEPQSAQGQLETSYLLFLTLVFVFIILEGLFIALSVRAPLSCLVPCCLYTSCQQNALHAQQLCVRLLRASIFGSCCVQGFLPEAADQLAQNVVYPAFSPSVGFFLLLSSIYGIWKVTSSCFVVCFVAIASLSHTHHYASEMCRLIMGVPLMQSRQ